MTFTTFGVIYYTLLERTCYELFLTSTGDNFMDFANSFIC